MLLRRRRSPVGQPQTLVRAQRRTVRQDPRRGLADFASRCLALGEADFHAEILESFEPQENGAGLVAGLDYLLNTDLRPRLTKAPAGTIIIQGDEDAIVPPAQAEILRHCLKEARVVRLPGAGHAPFLTQAAAFNEVVGRIFREETRGRGPLPPPSNSLPQPLKGHNTVGNSGP